MTIGEEFLLLPSGNTYLCTLAPPLPALRPSIITSFSRNISLTTRSFQSMFEHTPVLVSSLKITTPLEPSSLPFTSGYSTVFLLTAEFLQGVVCTVSTPSCTLKRQGSVAIKKTDSRARLPEPAFCFCSPTLGKSPHLSVPLFPLLWNGIIRVLPHKVVVVTKITLIFWIYKAHRTA